MEDKFKFASLTMGMTKRASFPSSAAEHLPLEKIRNKGSLSRDLEANLQNGFHCSTSVSDLILGKNYSYIEHFLYCRTVYNNPALKEWLSTASPQRYFLKVYRAEYSAE